mmetsp:Transcript_1456/g.2113  ORF Transcript_1456/g.2113 Transcript_1456/m.2113 type:complete len:560 (-) Transcript_1456:252-1931(-)
MDTEKSGQIRIKEFIDHLMGRWNASINTIDTDNKPKNDFYTGGTNYMQKQTFLVDDRPDPDLSKEVALNQLRVAISQRLRSGPHGLLRCWIDFRQRAGSTKDGITKSEFARGVKAYNVPLHPNLIDEIHKQMDVDGDGHIQINEFIDNVMGRNVCATIEGVGENDVDYSENNGVSSKLQQKQRKNKQNMINETPDESLQIDDALRMLRKYITQRLKSGPNGLMRCWFEFRLRAGSSKDGITRSEFARGLRLYGIPLTPAKTSIFFDRMDLDKDGYIQINEFIDVIMGRWDASSNSGGVDKSAQIQNMHDTTKCVHIDTSYKEQYIQVSADQALILLRAKIAQRLKGGPHGLQRAWKVFRCAGGGDHDGVSATGFARALKIFQLPLQPHIIQQLFSRFQLTSHNKINEHTFITVIMGRPMKEIILDKPSHQLELRSTKIQDTNFIPPGQSLPFSPITTTTASVDHQSMPNINEEQHSQESLPVAAINKTQKQPTRIYSARHQRPATAALKKKPNQLQSVPYSKRPSTARLYALQKSAKNIHVAEMQHHHELKAVKKFCSF